MPRCAPSIKAAASADLAKAFQLPIKFERRDALSAP